MNLKIYNTISKDKEIFVPIIPKQISMYVCGMTVYDYCHLGHARAYTAFDAIYRFLIYLGYSVKYIRNITDIDDKIINRAKETIPNYKNDPKKACLALSEKFTEAFHEDMKKLKLTPPTIEPKATEHISEIITIIQKLIDTGFAYVADNGVYFKVSAFQEYGQLSKRNILDLETQSRIDQDTNKNNNLDFALWKTHKEDEPYWESPFGKGRPGWHIECSAMSMKYLGDEFDIHGGGQDLIFPHHENEIAQSRAYSGKNFAKYWVHNGFITINQEKMSKSLKNFKTVRELLQVYKPMHLKYYLLSTHYRSPLDFSDTLIANTAEGLKKIENTLNQANIYLNKLNIKFNNNSNLIPDSFVNAMCDDFNTPKAIGEIFHTCTELNKLVSNNSTLTQKIFDYYTSIKQMLEILGIEPETDTSHVIKKIDFTESQNITDILNTPHKNLVEDQINQLVSARGYAKQNNNYGLADSIRKFLLTLNIEIQDQKDGCIWKYK